jgi:hypothetical protein
MLAKDHAGVRGVGEPRNGFPILAMLERSLSVIWSKARCYEVVSRGKTAFAIEAKLSKEHPASGVRKGKADGSRLGLEQKPAHDGTRLQL